MQLNVSKFSTCTYKLQIGYIIITTQVTKLFPKLHTFTQILQPLTAAVVPTIDIYLGLQSWPTDIATWTDRQHVTRL